MFAWKTATELVYMCDRSGTSLCQVEDCKSVHANSCVSNAVHSTYVHIAYTHMRCFCLLPNVCNDMMLESASWPRQAVPRLSQV